MMTHQQEAIVALRRYTDEAEQALLVEEWSAASIALAGCWFAIDELQRGMPRPDPNAVIGFL